MIASRIAIPFALALGLSAYGATKIVSDAFSNRA